MFFDEFLDELLENLLDQKGIDRVKQVIKEEINRTGTDYDTTKVEYQVFVGDDNYDPEVEIKFVGDDNYDPEVEIKTGRYDDGEVIFLDIYLDLCRCNSYQGWSWQSFFH